MDILRPVVGVLADRRLIEPHWFSAVGEKYLLALRDVANVLPVILPVYSDEHALPGYIQALASGAMHGVFLPGSPSNVAPWRYGGKDDHLLRDEARDGVSLELIRWSAENAVPIFGVCRGFQEMNVALGGTLHAEVHCVTGFDDHRDDESLPLEDQYAPVHDVHLDREGALHTVLGVASLRVNSLHGQGIDRLAPGLRVEARAGDGLIEAFSIPTSTADFAMGVQWHPEWRAAHSPFSTRLFEAFGDACRKRMKNYEFRRAERVAQA